MGPIDLLSWLSRLGGSRSEEVTASHRELAESARSDELTPELLARAGDRTSEPLATYLEDGEQPNYVLRGNQLLIVDEDGAMAQRHPTRLMVVLVSDVRLVFVVGKRLVDDLYEIPLEAIASIYLDEDPPHRYVVVEADREGDRMTFFADVGLDSTGEVEEAIEYVRPAE